MALPWHTMPGESNEDIGFKLVLPQKMQQITTGGWL